MNKLHVLCQQMVAKYDVYYICACAFSKPKGHYK